jgi:hypothetical protein
MAGAGFDTRLVPGTVTDLEEAGLVMLVSSSRGPVRVRSLDGRALDVTEDGARALDLSCSLLGYVGA